MDAPFNALNATKSACDIYCFCLKHSPVWADFNCGVKKRDMRQILTQQSLMTQQWLSKWLGKIGFYFTTFLCQIKDMKAFVCRCFFELILYHETLYLAPHFKLGFYLISNAKLVQCPKCMNTFLSKFTQFAKFY